MQSVAIRLVMIYNNVMNAQFELGISTASLFMRYYTEEALPIVRRLGAETAEVFMGTFREYKPDFGVKFAAARGDLPIHSIHTLNQHFEPELFNASPRTREDAEEWLRLALANGQMMGAKYYTFHGQARLKRRPYIIDWPTFGPKVRHVNEICQEYGITLCYENVHWTLYNYPQFILEAAPYDPDLRATLDIKQAMQAGIDAFRYLEAMGDRLATVHVVDYDKDERLCLPGKGIFDFKQLFQRLSDMGFAGAVIIEAYQNNYDQIEELQDSLQYLKSLRQNVK